MSIDELFNAPKLPGIYYFCNKLNGKYYIGQAQDIHDRVRHHLTNFKANRYPDTHLYRGFKKHGLDVFKFGVLEIVDLPKGNERNKKLDELEIKYIKEYNSYGKSGYNQTRGGDGGIDGYKFTDIQKKRTRINGLRKILEGRYKLFFYDVHTNQYGEVLSFSIFLEAVNKVDDNNRFKEKQICYFGRYILSHSETLLKEKVNKYFSKEYNYTFIDSIDNSTENLQSCIDKIVANIKKEVDDFLEKYGKAKYNRKDNKAKKDALKKEQKADLEAGITRKEYKEKYNIKSDAAFYEHVKKLCPEWKNKDERTSNNQNILDDILIEEIKKDIANGMPCNLFLDKYKIAESVYYRYKIKIENETGQRIISNKYKAPGESISEEQEKDILNKMNCIEYCNKYDVCENTFYDHRKLIKQKYPECDFNQDVHYKAKIDIELIRDDLLNGISRREFCLKYNLSESTYKKYKKIILEEENIPATITSEMEQDIKNGMSEKEYSEKYHVSRDTYYNHKKIIGVPKRHITLNDIITDEQRNDLISGMDMFDYMEKYGVISSTYYEHRKFVIPDANERCNQKQKRESNKGFSDAQKTDLLNRMSERDYMLKYRVSSKTYKNHKKKAFADKETKESEEK